MFTTQSSSKDEGTCQLCISHNGNRRMYHTKELVDGLYLLQLLNHIFEVGDSTDSGILPLVYSFT